MKTLLALSALTLLMTGCSQETSMTEDTGALDPYGVNVDIDGSDATNENTETDVENPEDEPVTSVGPNGELPADLIPSR